MQNDNAERTDFDAVIFQLEGSGMWETQELLRQKLALCEKALTSAETVEQLDRIAPFVSQGIDNADIFENGRYILQGFLDLDVKWRAKLAKMEE